jgi:hypothetical protein
MGVLLQRISDGYPPRKSASAMQKNCIDESFPTFSTESAMKRHHGLVADLPSATGTVNDLIIV